MAAWNFPSFPTEGQQYSHGGRTWTWRGEHNAWLQVAVSTSDADAAAASAVAAANASRLTVGTVTTGAPGSAAVLSITGPAGSQQLNLTIPTGPQGTAGQTGVGIASITQISGDSSPGTTDVYRITLEDASFYDFSVYNGADGAGSGVGDMLKSVYDPTNSGKVASAVSADAVPWTGVSGKPAVIAAGADSATARDSIGAASQSSLTTLSGDTTTALAGKVDKVAGKGLSEADFTSVEKTKLAGIAEGATANVGTVTSVTGTAPIASTGGATPAISINSATTSNPGSMSAADKAKLDGIAAGATQNSSDAALIARGNHTGTQAISTVAGLQGALDAKAPLTGAGTYGTWPISVSGNAATATSANTASAAWSSATVVATTADTNYSAVVRSPVGGSGDTSVAALGFLNGSSYGLKMYLRADGFFGIGGWTRAAWGWYLDASNNMIVAGNVSAYSDPRLKENFERVSDPFAILNKLDGGAFTWRHGFPHIASKAGKRDYGILADQVKGVMPEIVTDSVEIDGQAYMTVAYDKLVPVLIEAIKMLKEEIDQLKGVCNATAK